MYARRGERDTVALSLVSLRLPTIGLLALLGLGLAVFALGARSNAAVPAVTPVDSPKAAARSSSAAMAPRGAGRLRPAAARRLEAALAADERRDQLVLEGANWQAGGTKVAFQACDDSRAKTGLWTKAHLPGERQRLRRQPVRARRDRHLQLRLRRRR